VSKSLYREADATFVELPDAESGSLDRESLASIRPVLLALADEPGPRYLVLDLASVHYFGASFIGLLVDTWHLLKKHSRQLLLCELTPYCASLVRTLHLAKLFGIYPTRRDVLEKIGPTGSREGEVRPGRVLIRKSDVAWDPSLVRLEYVGDDSSPIRSVIVPRAREATEL
jgi:anti-anti-sigma factor